VRSDINQQQRERTLSDFRAGIFNVLVATGSQDLLYLLY
jgi:superfamily II DNA/RNA helicase